MNYLIWTLAILGGCIALYWIASALIGIFGDKEKLGTAQLRKILADNGVDPNSFSNNQMRNVARNALSSTIYSGRNFGKYDATEYMENLLFHAQLIIALSRNQPLNEDANMLIQQLLERK